MGSGIANAPSDAATGSPVCSCIDNQGVADIGFTVGMWDPSTLVEFTDTPGCSSVLNGTKFPFNQTYRGTSGARASLNDGEPNASFHHYHYYAFPLVQMLELFTGKGCSSNGYSDLDVMFMSELDPTWNRDELAFFSTPEAVMVTNPVSLVACTADAAASSVGKPLDSMFWCAGSWGGLYPLSGTQNHFNGIIDQTSLAKTKLLASLHRRGLQTRTMGDDYLCGGELSPFIPKSQYKFTLVYPVPETNKAHVIGEPSLKWGSGRTIPGIANFPIYLNWQWVDCCIR